jgi:hypothetical protein
MPSLANYGHSWGRSNVASAVPDSIQTGPYENQARSFRPRGAPGKAYFLYDPGDNGQPEHRWLAKWSMLPSMYEGTGATVSFGFKWSGQQGHVMWFGDVTNEFPQGIEAKITFESEISQFFLRFGIFVNATESVGTVTAPLISGEDYHFTAVFLPEIVNLGEFSGIGRWRIYRNGLLVDSSSTTGFNNIDISITTPSSFYVGTDYLGDRLFNSPIYDLKMFYRPLSHNEVWNSYFYDYIKEQKQVPLTALAVESDGPDRTASGGARVGGNGDVTADYDIVADGGAVLAGMADEFYVHNGSVVYDEFASGGAVLAGSAVVRKIVPFSVTGGAVLAGSAVVRKTFRHTATGGAVVAGFALRTANYFVQTTGGIEAGGSLTTIATEYASGGVSCGGSFVLKRGTVRPKRQSECFDAKVCKLRIQQIGSLSRRVYIEDQCRRPFRLWDGYVPGAASCPGEIQFTRILKVQTAVGYKNPRDRGKLPNSNFGDVR